MGCAGAAVGLDLWSPPTRRLLLVPEVDDLHGELVYREAVNEAVGSGVEPVGEVFFIESAGWFEPALDLILTEDVTEAAADLVGQLIRGFVDQVLAIKGCHFHVILSEYGIGDKLRRRLAEGDNDVSIVVTVNSDFFDVALLLFYEASYDELAHRERLPWGHTDGQVGLEYVLKGSDNESGHVYTGLGIGHAYG